MRPVAALVLVVVLVPRSAIAEPSVAADDVAVPIGGGGVWSPAVVRQSWAALLRWSLTEPVVETAGAPWLRVVDPMGEAGGQGEGLDDWTREGFEAMRLGLMSDVAPMARAYGSGCEVAGAATAGSFGAPQRALAVRLVPNLTLARFSSLGCAVDAALGGGLVYVKPVSRNVAFTMSVGRVVLPHHGPDGGPVVVSQARAGFTFRLPDQRSLSVAVTAGGVGPGVAVGGRF